MIAADRRSDFGRAAAGQEQPGLPTLADDNIIGSA
jgi:hypothetical protein